MEQRLARRAATDVAQICNLLYRRIVFGRMSDSFDALAPCGALQSATLRYGRVQLCATAASHSQRCGFPTSALRLLSALGLRGNKRFACARQARSMVAQICNLLYRRIVFGRVLDWSDASARFGGLRGTVRAAAFRVGPSGFFRPSACELRICIFISRKSTWPAGSSTPVSWGARRRRKSPARRAGS